MHLNYTVKQAQATVNDFVQCERQSHFASPDYLVLT